MNEQSFDSSLSLFFSFFSWCVVVVAQEGRPIRVFTVLFSQGVNTAQTKANMMGETALQDGINEEK
jgi:hypothetical protein